MLPSMAKESEFQQLYFDAPGFEVPELPTQSDGEAFEILTCMGVHVAQVPRGEGAIPASVVMLDTFAGIEDYDDPDGLAAA